MTAESENFVHDISYIFLSGTTPAENLALDEALLNQCEHGSSSSGILRCWESPEHFAVIGHGNCLETEVCCSKAEAQGIPVLRRISGGGAVLQGPGCLNYSLILPTSLAACANVGSTNRFVMMRNREALQHFFEQPVEVTGDTDLSVSLRKFSGNSQRRLRRFFLFHGTLLYDFDLDLMEQLLPMPSREPDYRRKRSHTQFLTNIGVPAEHICQHLRRHWRAEHELKLLPFEETRQLVVEKYSTNAWTRKC